MEHKYRDEFLSPTEFQWQRQYRTRQDTEIGRDLRRYRELGSRTPDLRQVNIMRQP